MIRITAVAFLLVGMNAVADTQIHRCPLDDGTFAFQEVPCAEPVEESGDGTQVTEKSVPGEAADENAKDFDFVNPFDEPPDPPASAESLLPESISKDRVECEKTTRDAIDAIDLEMRQNPYTKEQGQAYLSKLRVLTQQLRACKQL
ncbi:MAG TPA: hypothetical protein PKH39_03425 [Woeseiaceae bacterium]|nr:hypothetical protein [Woeseiaceae bacterium]